MVVVEGVARSMDPHMNIWQVAQPIVTDYVSKSIGPRALLNDLRKAALVLARFGPQLPRLAEDVLIRLNNPPPPPKLQRRRARLSWMALGGVIVGAAWFVQALV